MIVRADSQAIQQAAALLKSGGVAAFPTETVYGLGADATNPAAVAKVFALKNRPSFDPLIVHVASAEEAKTLWLHCPAIAEKLMQRFWPGPLTLVLPKSERIPDIVTAGLPSVAVRMPSHPVARTLLIEAGRPIAAPSANRFGRASPTAAAVVEEELGKELLILDGGPARIGVESTVIAFDGERPVLLRPGGLTLEEISSVAGPVSIGERNPKQHAASPGMLERHYAPAKPLYLLDEIPVALRQSPHWRASPKRVGVLLLAPMRVAFTPSAVEVLASSGDLVKAAANFFQALHKLDHAEIDVIVATAIPKHGLGLALSDRLSRAASGWARIAKHGLELLDHR